jgi:hypothetical protein
MDSGHVRVCSSIETVSLYRNYNNNTIRREITKVFDGYSLQQALSANTHAAIKDKPSGSEESPKKIKKVNKASFI